MTQYSGIYISDLSHRTLGDSVIVSEVTIPSVEIKTERKEQVLEIEIEHAWEKTHSVEDWKGEVSVEFEIL